MAHPTRMGNHSQSKWTQGQAHRGSVTLWTAAGPGKSPGKQVSATCGLLKKIQYLDTTADSSPRGEPRVPSEFAGQKAVKDAGPCDLSDVDAAN